ncbi:MAG TPA: LytTR family DNA-binding domain-containing protein [Saprospiraceae bacterium]|nr:LytTR family DNA-binding domain-containing protein [Saprospiraceae bacterium]
MYNCLIIEDEPLAAEILSDYISEVSDLHLMDVCRDVMTASGYLRSHKIDILFVDIHLPKINGIDFIKTIQNQSQVILTTAYDHYALEGYNLNVVDYLLKPIEFSRFLQAIQKIKRNHTTISEPAEGNPRKDSFHFFNVDKRQVKVFLDDILYIESLKEYIKIHTHENYLLTKLQIGEFESLLASPNLLRVHKSYIINLNKVTAYSANLIEIGKHQIPIGRTYKEFIMKHLK